MKRIIKKTDAGRNDGRATSAVMMRTASLSARDPLAYAAALQILG